MSVGLHKGVIGSTPHADFKMQSASAPVSQCCSRQKKEHLSLCHDKKSCQLKIYLKKRMLEVEMKKKKKTIINNK